MHFDDRVRAALAAGALATLTGAALPGSGAALACERQPAIEGLAWSVCAGGSVWIVETTRPIDLFVSHRRVPTLRQRLARSPRAALLVNGSYHDGNYARPVFDGLLRIGERTIAPAKVADRQLTHLLSIDRSGRLAAILPATAAGMAALAPDSNAVQTGPAILQDGAIATAAIRGSLNGIDAYKRTAIGRTRAGETVIVIARTPWTLTDLGSFVAATDDYAGRGLTLVNLDGGPSTAIHSAIVPPLSYGADKVTPVGLAVR